MSDENTPTPVVPTDEMVEAADEASKATEAAGATAETTETTTAEEPIVAEEVKTEETVEEKLPGTEIRPTEIKAGMTIRVHERVKDLNTKGEERERIQIFQGMVLGTRGASLAKTMTIRREQKGFGVEKIYPLFSPVVTKIELVKTARVRRSKLSYLKNPRRRFKRKLKEKRAVAE